MKVSAGHARTDRVARTRRASLEFLPRLRGVRERLRVRSRDPPLPLRAGKSIIPLHRWETALLILLFTHSRTGRQTGGRVQTRAVHPQALALALGAPQAQCHPTAPGQLCGGPGGHRVPWAESGQAFEPSLFLSASCIREPARLAISRISNDPSSRIWMQTSAGSLHFQQTSDAPALRLADTAS